MQIREAKERDISEIIEVLRASLGEISSRKTEEVWRYKHINNPFGKSLVLIAEEDAEIIGVRAFMRWRWQKGEKLYSAFRAVDTATHPSHQGKGIFKKLTLEALKIGRAKGDHFVFNTPNTQSKPGYLKMGWKEVDKLIIQLRPLNLLKMKKKELDYAVIGKISDSEELVDSIFEEKKKNLQFFTPKNIEFLKWRYVNNPLQQYHVISNRYFFIAGYLKKRDKLNEFRISEVLISQDYEKQAKMAILEMANTSGAKVLSVSPNSDIAFKTGVASKIGPVLTLKSVSLSEVEEGELLNLSVWDYSLGDLELF